jgi:RNA polymerase-binding transcription factor DksA
MLTEEQVARFREQLEAEQARALEKINTLNDELAQNDYNYPLDWSDGAVRLYSDEDVMFERNRLQSELVRVEHALERVAAGTYGYSELSGKPIPVERLEALPTATTLVDEPPPKLVD